MKFETYNLTAANGRHIRQATKAILDDGTEIRFTEKMTKAEAVRAVEQQLALEADLRARQRIAFNKCLGKRVPKFVKSATTGKPVPNTVAGILGSWSSR
jgi:hypothetical protein